MYKIKERKIWVLIAVYGILSLIFHMFFMETGLGDDPHLLKTLKQTAVFDFVLDRWNGWSSRVVIETVLGFIMKQPIWVFKGIDIMVSMVIAYCFLGTAFYKKEVGNSVYLAFFMLLLYDFREMSSAGYMTTLMNYWWPLAAAMLAVIPLYKQSMGEKVPSWVFLLTIPCLIFAANQEQMAIILFCLGIYFLGMYHYEGRKVSKYLYSIVIISLISLLTVMICPGNAVRKIANTEFWFPQFSGFSFLQKGLLGWYGVLRTLFEDINWLFMGFGLLLMLAVWKKSRKWYKRLIGAIPVLSNIALMACLMISKVYDAGPVNKVVHAFDFDQPVVYYHGSLPVKLRILMLTYTAVCICVVVSMFFLWGATKQFCHLLMVLTIGTISKMSMGISPTVWASSERTSIFLLFSLIFVGSQCGRILFEENSPADGIQ